MALPDGTRCVLPAWMLDPVRCAGLSEAEQPRIELEALHALRRLVDAQPELRKLSSEARARARQGGDR